MKKFQSVLISGFLVAMTFGCTKAAPIAPTVKAADPGAMVDGQTSVVDAGNGAKVAVVQRAGVKFIQVEGTFASDEYTRMLSSMATKPQNERTQAISGEIQAIFEKVSAASAIPLRQIPEAGYFTFLTPFHADDLMADLKQLHFARQILLNPVAHDPDALEQVRALSPESEGLVPRSQAAAGTGSFSGLARIHAPEFVKQAEADIGGGVKVNGSSVKIGITDTGITLNHPTFFSAADGHNRVAYLKDFTREGRVYFNPNAKFEAKAVDGADDQLQISAEVILTPKLPNLPAGDDLEAQTLKIQVSPELKALLLAPQASGAKLGLLLESDFQSDGAETELVDINANGKLDDQFPMILIPGKTSVEDVVYVDFTATKDFRSSKPLAGFNRNRDTVAVFAETIGFDLEDDKLPAKDGKSTVALKSASIVGFDAGNHGSHVSGIAAGTKTISNDSDDTLARGVAPEATILMNRVCANNGGCGATEAFIDLATKAGAEVINMSLGGLSPFNDGYGVQETLINRLTSLNNVLFSISAGNSGPARQTVGSPSVARLSMSVGASASRGLIERQYQWPGTGLSTPESATSDDDFMLFFSSRGPTAAGGFKPNLAAPGTELSSVQLNAAPGQRGGLDVYWGTSMAAPTMTGAYALFLDAVKKYNLKNAASPLPSDATVLRQILIQSARPFDVARFNPETGEKLTGQYTWADEGKGLVDLSAAWKKIFEARDRALASAVKLDGGASVELDYQVLTPLIAPNGLAYDGSRPAGPGTPALGNGLYLNSAGTETLRPVYIARRLSERLAASEKAGILTRQLQTTRDEFVLKTVYYGAAQEWLKAGVLDRLGCDGSASANLSVVGKGVEVEVKPDGTGDFNPFKESALNVCLDRAKIAQLPPGDHGALIEGYRTVGGQVAVLPSFTVPVFVTIPHQVLAGSTAYEVNRELKSFGVSRNYVSIPKGATLAQVTLEVPAMKAGSTDCSGVELMALEGDNQTAPFKTRADARISACDSMGNPNPDSKRKLSFAVTNPKPGIWDLHVFGQYKYAKSQYRMRVDYAIAQASVDKIEGTLSAIQGSVTFKVSEASMDVQVDAAKSALSLRSLSAQTKASVVQDGHTFVQGPLGILRAYPAGTRRVTIGTFGSPGNDIDLTILECPADAKTADDKDCITKASSGGPTDVESASFKPDPGMVYAARVDGYDVKDQGNFISSEAIEMAEEKSPVTLSGAQPSIEVQYALSADFLAASKLATSDLFTSGKYGISGELTLRMANGAVLASIPVKAYGTRSSSDRTP